MKKVKYRPKNRQSTQCAELGQEEQQEREQPEERQDVTVKKTEEVETQMDMESATGAEEGKKPGGGAQQSVVDERGAPARRESEKARERVSECEKARERASESESERVSASESEFATARRNTLVRPRRAHAEGTLFQSHWCGPSQEHASTARQKWSCDDENDPDADDYLPVEPEPAATRRPARATA